MFPHVALAKPVYESNAHDNLVTELSLDILFSKVSPLYSQLLEKGLINSTFSKEYFAGRGFASLIVSGESTQPEKVRDEILSYIDKVKNEGVSDEDFNVSLKRLYGREVFSYNDTDNLSGNLINCYFGGYGLFDTIDLYKKVTKQDVEKVIDEKFTADNFCLSVIK